MKLAFQIISRRKYDFYHFAFQGIISSASRITPHFMEGEGSCRVDKSLQLVPVLSQTFPVYRPPKPRSFQRSLCFRFPPQKFCSHFALHHIPPFAAGLMILDLINLIIFGKEHKSFCSKWRKFLRSLVTSKM